MAQQTPKLGRRVPPPLSGTPSAAGMLWPRASRQKQLLPQLLSQLLQQLQLLLPHPSGSATVIRLEAYPLWCSSLSAPLLLPFPLQQLSLLCPLGCPHPDQQPPPAGHQIWRQGAFWWEHLVLMSPSCTGPPCRVSRQMPFRQYARLPPRQSVSHILKARKRRQTGSAGDPRLPHRVRNRALLQRTHNQTQPTLARVSQALALAP